MGNLIHATEFCDALLKRSEFKDFKGAENGLQIENNGTISKVGAAVDGGLQPFKQAIEAGVDFLIVHHGIFWTPPVPLTGHNYQKIRLAMDNNLAVYGAHLPLDAHPEIGNNALLAKNLGLKTGRTFLNYEGQDIGIIAKVEDPFSDVLIRLKKLFPQTYTAIEFGTENPQEIAILTGSGTSAIPALKANGVDTLITGELKQNHYNQAQEESLNLYPCGHYATETFGVCALAEMLSKKLGIPWTFIETDCPL
ncbi:MAG: Nif3-like dinuclear metal center hexameric protein [Verrucomicrobiota bacterium]